MTTRPFNRILSKTVQLELTRIAQLHRPWLVADMDSTLLQKERGMYPDLNASPCQPHLLTWLRSGGKLLVITSDEGRRPFKQLLGQIPRELRAAVVLAAGEGAALYKHSKLHQTFVEDSDYIATRTPGLPHPLKAVEIACDLKRDFMTAAFVNRTLLDQVAPQSRQDSYQVLFNSISTAKELTQLLTNDYLMKMGALPQFRGSCIWRNNSTIPKGWDKTNSKNPTTALQPLPELPARWTTLWILGIGHQLSSSTFITAKYQARFDALGIHAEPAPNSILLKNQSCSKALPIEYMWELLENNAVAFGDNPLGNDKPMTLYEERGLPFISVAATLEETPLHCQPLFVGGLEAGTALCLEYMNARRKERGVAAEEESKL